MFLSISNETSYNIDEFNIIYKNLLKKNLNILKKNDNVIMSVTFVNKKEIQRINKEYRNIDRATDVISFAFLDDKSEQIFGDLPLDLGEIYICYEVAQENAINYGNTLKRELSFLFVHGLLHLLGYDHMKKEDEVIMFGLQDQILGD